MPKACGEHQHALCVHRAWAEKHAAPALLQLSEFLEFSVPVSSQRPTWREGACWKSLAPKAMWRLGLSMEACDRSTPGIFSMEGRERSTPDFSPRLGDFDMLRSDSVILRPGRAAGLLLQHTHHRPSDCCLFHILQGMGGQVYFAVPGVLPGQRLST